MVQKQKPVVTSLSDELRRDISLGIIKPGEKLNIEGLKRDYSVSHPSVREALSLLAGEGYVSFEESKGFRVLSPSQAELQDIIRVRAELEAMALAWAVERSTLDWRSQVIAAHYALSEVEPAVAPPRPPEIDDADAIPATNISEAKIAIKTFIPFPSMECRVSPGKRIVS